MNTNDIMIQETQVADEDVHPVKIAESRVNAFIDKLAEINRFSNYKRKNELENIRESTSDFPYLLGGVINRMLYGSYKAATPNWRKFVKARSVSDLRQFEIIKLWGANTLDKVEEQGPYKNFGQYSGKYTGKLGKYGAKYGLSWESLINDTLNGFGDLSSKLTNMALMTEWYLATKLMVASTGPNTALYGATVSDAADGKAITNKGSLPLTLANLQTTMTLMRSQKDSNGLPMMVTPKYLVVPEALRYDALNLTKSPTLILGMTGTGTKEVLKGINNTIVDDGLEVVVNPWLSQIDTSGKVDATWYLFADPNDIPAIQMTFLSGYEVPQVAIKANGIQGGSVGDGDFDHDSIWYRVRHVLGPITLDPRGTYAQTGS